MFPGNLPTGPMKQHVKRITRPFSIDRQRDRDDSKAGVGENYENDVTTAELYLYDESDTNDIIQEYGEIRRGSIQGVCLAGADIEIGDRLEYGNNRYELVEPIEYIPSESNAVILQLAFERVEVEQQTDIL